jgi:hypothetical protein
MITLLLTRAREDEGVYLKLPSSPAEIGEAFAELGAISTDTSTTKITEVLSNVYNLSGYIKNTDVEAPGAVDKLGELARKLQTMIIDDCLKFEGVLDANSVNGIEDGLRLADALDDYTVLPDACAGTALGKYLVEHGVGRFPENVRPYLDYQIIGEEFYADHGGAYCRSGYAVRKDVLPAELIERSQGTPEWLMLLRLRSKIKATELTHPATRNHGQSKGKAGQRTSLLKRDRCGRTHAGRICHKDSQTASPWRGNSWCWHSRYAAERNGELRKYLSVQEAIAPGYLHRGIPSALET